MLILSIVILLTYLGFALYKQKDIPHSISMTYYLLPDNFSWVFRVVMILIPALILPVWLGVPEDNYRFLAFLGCSGMMFVGCAPNLHILLENKVHYVSAITCCISACLWQIFTGFWMVLVGWFILCSIGYVWKRQIIWWIEIMAIGSVISDLLYLTL